MRLLRLVWAIMVLTAAITCGAYAYIVAAQAVTRACTGACQTPALSALPYGMVGLLALVAGVFGALFGASLGRPDRGAEVGALQEGGPSLAVGVPSMGFPQATPASAEVAPPPLRLEPTVMQTPGARASRPETDNRLADLIRDIISVRDLLPDGAVSERLGLGLEHAGVAEYDGVGRAFDPTRHRVVDFVSATSPDEVGTVAAAERVGYSSEGKVIRPADVVLFRAES